MAGAVGWTKAVGMGAAQAPSRNGATERNCLMPLAKRQADDAWLNAVGSHVTANSGRSVRRACTNIGVPRLSRGRKRNCLR
jgi:hypothetical protein